MKLTPFKLERFFAKYEFSVKYLLSSSDCDGLLQSDLLNMADFETRKLWGDLTLGYTESLGHPLLREEISKLYKGLKSDDCLVTVPEEGIFIALNCILDKGDHVICTFPGYQSLYEIAKGLGCEVTHWIPDEKASWRFDPDFLEQNIQPNTKLVVMNFPHNPTGSLPARKDFDRIIELARKHRFYLLSDEMYRFLEYEKGDRLPSASEEYEHAVSISGMSKTFGMAGARIGWLCTKDQNLYQKMAALKDYTTICSSASSEILSIIGLRNRERIIENHLTRIKRNLRELDLFFLNFADRFEWVKPIAGTIAFPRLLGAESSSQFCMRLINDANILLLPSTVYDFGDRHFRLGFGRENLPDALEKLNAFLKK